MGSNRNDSRPTSSWRRRFMRAGKINYEETVSQAVHQEPEPPITPVRRYIAADANLIDFGIDEDSISPRASVAYPRDVSPKAEGWQPALTKLASWRDEVAHEDVDQPVEAEDEEAPPQVTDSIPSDDTPKSPRQILWTLPELRRFSPAFPESNQGSISSPSPIHPAFRMAHYSHTDSEFLEKRPFSAAASATISRSSTASLDNFFDDSSSRGRISSMTSVEEEDEDDDVVVCDYVEAKARTASEFSILSPTSIGVFEDRRTSEADNAAADIGRSPSPTLSELVRDLESRLETIQEDGSQAQDDIDEQDAAPTQTPGLPRRSRKRDWKDTISLTNLVPKAQIPADVLIRRSSAPVVKADPQAKADLLAKLVHDNAETAPLAQVDLTVRPPPRTSITLDSSEVVPQDQLVNKLTPSTMSTRLAAAPSTHSEAQTVLLGIMSSFDTVEDLLATSMMNRGMHRVYKANEMTLLKTVVRNHSPALWELREWSPVEFSDLDGCISPELNEHSPFTYMHGFRKDQIILESLKTLILERCQPLLRTETVAALALEEDDNRQRFDDAFYRIWCFCKIFGSEKGREHDVTGQLDWLRGGILARQDDCAATINMNMEFDMGGVLLNAPDYFALGNKGGLSASELYDMTELWNCLTALLGFYHGKTDQARKCGVFDNMSATSEAEEKAVLEEWMSYILTLGPSVILELAKFDEENLDAGFKVARFNGWTDWMPTISGASRHTFFREPVARLYEEQLVAAAKGVPSSIEQDPVSAQKIAKVAAEMKLARSTSGLRPSKSRHDSGMPAPLQKKGSRASGHFDSWAGKGSINSTIDENIKTSDRLKLLSLEGIAENTVEIAIAKIVRLGFSDAQAKEALKVTDMGSGLRVDHAVDLLLGQTNRLVVV